jgi:hypothetical protein
VDSRLLQPEGPRACPHRYNLDMLTWPDLGAVANEIYRVSRQLLEEARRLETEDRPVRDFRRTDALPRLLILSDRLEVSFSDRLHVERRTIPLSQERGSVSSTRVEVDIEYHAIAEVRQRCSESGPFVAFHFATTWPRLDPGAASPEARVRAQRELRRLDTVLQNTWTARRSWNEQARTPGASCQRSMIATGSSRRSGLINFERVVRSKKRSGAGAQARRSCSHMGWARSCSLVQLQLTNCA